MKEDLSNKKILCVGELLWDMLPSGPKAGGAPMNVALHLKRLGLNAKFAGKVGNDKLGESLKNFLVEKGMDVSLIQTDFALPTSTVEVIIESNQNVKFNIVDNVAWDNIEINEELKQESKESDVLVYGTLASRHINTRKTILTLIENSNLKLIDVNLRPPYINKEVIEQLILKADIAKLNDDELKMIGSWYHKDSDIYNLTRWFAHKFNCAIVCVTRGDKGALVIHDEEIDEHPGFKVNVIDTVGSGDAFLAGFLSKYLARESIKSALSFACATGALVASKQGATPDYSINEINYLNNIN